MCGDGPDPTPEVNDDDVKGDNALPKGLAASDGQDTLKLGPKQPYLEAFDSKTFVEVFNQFKDVENYTVATSVDQAWRDIGDLLHSKSGTFKDQLNHLLEGGDWEGESIKAAFDNAIKSVEEPFYTGTAAMRGAELVHKFRDTLDYVVNNLVHDVGGTFNTLYDRYLYDLSDKTQYVSDGYSAVPITTTPDAKRIEEHYNTYMRNIMNESYKPGLTDVGNGYPQFSLDTTPAVKDAPQTPGSPITPGSGPASGTPSSGAGTPSFTPPKSTATPSIPKSPTNALPQGLPQGIQEGASQAADAAQTGLSGATDAAKQATSGATDAAKQAAAALKKLGGQKPTLPEGVLNLAKGLKTSTPGSGAKVGGGSKGPSLGAPPKGLPSRTASPITTAANSSAASPVGASRSGIGSSSPGAGAPAAGARGAGSDGKEHKVSKALRNRKNGAGIVGEAEAVVSVVGDEGDQKQASQQQSATQHRK